MNLPKVEIDNLLPVARKMFLQWDDFMYSRICFNMPDSEIHAASHCKRFCHDNDDIVFHPEAVFLMRYHDRDDNIGKEAIRKRFDKDADRVLKLYAIFKDADALDRWRLGSKGIDPKYLRTEASKNLAGYSHRIVNRGIRFLSPVGRPQCEPVIIFRFSRQREC